MPKLDLKAFSAIGPFRKLNMYYQHPESFSIEEAAKWVQGISEGGIGSLEVFLKENKLSIQLSSENNLSSSESEPYFSSIPLQEELECFQFNLKKPAIYSINMDQLSNSWISPIEPYKGEAWIQVIFQKDKYSQWSNQFKQQYEDYLKGIDYPSTFPLIRGLQQKLAHLSAHIHVSIPPLPTFEERQVQSIFRFQIRGYVVGERVERGHFIQQLLNRLNLQKEENEWEVIVKNKQVQEHVKKWRNHKPFLLGGSLICEKELVGLLPVTPVQLPEIKRKLQLRKTDVITNIFPIFQFLPRGDIQDEPFMTDLFEQELNGALEKIGIIKEEGLKIIGFEQGPTLMRLQAMLPKGIRLSDLQKGKTDLQVELGITDLSVSQGKAKGTGTLTLPRKSRQAVFLRNLVDTQEFQKFTKDKIIPFVVGVTETGEPLFEDLTRVKHLLVAGTTGSGKSVWLLQVILTLLLWVPSNQLMMFLIDPKRVEFPGFSSFPNVKVYTEIDEAKQLLGSLIELMETRYTLLGEEGVRNIAQYNRKNTGHPMPYVVAVIDEFSDFMMQDKDEGVVEDSIVRLAQKARACGIHLIITTQRPSVDVVTGLIKANLPSRVVFKCSSRNDYSTVLDQKPPFNLLGNGDGVCLMEGRVLTRFQGSLIAKMEEEMDRIINDYGKNQSGEAPLTLEIKGQTEQQFEDELSGPLEELKRYIAFTGETRITYLRKQLKMRMNDVKELMQKLVEEKWLEAPKSRNAGYKLLLSSEDREAYLNGRDHG